MWSVFHDSELDQSIYFAPKPLLGGKSHSLVEKATPILYHLQILLNIYAIIVYNNF